MTHAAGTTLAQLKLGLHFKFRLGCNRSNVCFRFSHSSARSTCLNKCQSWWRHQMKSFPRTGPLWGEPTRRTLDSPTKSSDAKLWCFLWCSSEKRLSKRSRCRWSETLWRSLWRDVTVMLIESYAKQMKNKWTDLQKCIISVLFQ